MMHENTPAHNIVCAMCTPIYLFGTKKNIISNGNLVYFTEEIDLVNWYGKIAGKC